MPEGLDQELQDAVSLELRAQGAERGDLGGWRTAGSLDVIQGPGRATEGF